MSTGIPVSIAELLQAFLNTTLFDTAYLHLGTGEVMFHNPRRHSEAQNEEIETTIFSDEDWLEIPYLDSDEEHAEMAAFAHSISDEIAKSKLISALSADKPFRQFRAVLTANPKIAQRWHIKRLEIAIKRAVEFCEAVDIAPEDPSWAALAESVHQNRTQSTARQWLAKLPASTAKKKSGRRPAGTKHKKQI
ncbi:MAG: hypothetical protein HUU55_04145 [Myxococcales bacterium]|nr:hypothetical protein [Myxococcales bacterium]